MWCCQTDKIAEALLLIISQTLPYRSSAVWCCERSTTDVFQPIPFFLFVRQWTFSASNIFQSTEQMIKNLI